MTIVRHSQTKASLGQGIPSLRGSVVSPYFQPTSTRKIGPRRDIRIIPCIMTLKALIASYVPSGTGVQVGVYFESDDGTIAAGTVLAVATIYTDTDNDIRGKISAVINTFCSGASLPVPTIDWLITTPTDLAAAIAAAIPVAPSSYQTIVSQTGTAAPAVSGSLVPTSTYPAGTTFTWARTGAGVYTLTASTAVFNTSGKTGVFVAPLQNLNAQAKAVVTSTTVITVTTAVASVAVLGLLGLTTTNTDALLSGTMLYVQTYA